MTVEVDVSIVLPVYNEVGHIEEELARIRESMDRSDLSYEIIVIDDGSTDGTGDLLEGMPGIRLMRFAQNRGSGSSRKYGTLSAKGNVVVWSDVDMTYPNDKIPELVAELDGWDQVVGARTSEEGTVKLLRKPAKWLIRKLASYLAAVKIPDLNSGFRAMRREVAEQFVYLLAQGLLLRDDDHDGVSQQRVLGQVRSHRVCTQGRQLQVPLVEGHSPLPAASHADGAAVQPAEGVHAAGSVPGIGRCRQADLRSHPEGLPCCHQHARGAWRRDRLRSPRHAGRPARSAQQAAT